jgi:hypothetical protein
MKEDRATESTRWKALLKELWSGPGTRVQDHFQPCLQTVVDAPRAAAMLPGDALTYTYDFGDNWQHLVTVEKVMAMSTDTYPCVVAGKVRLPTGADPTILSRGAI